MEKVGLYPQEELGKYAQNHIFIGYLSPTDYHRLHAPVAGTCIHCSLEDKSALSASVKFCWWTIHLLNRNKRLIIVLESKSGIRVVLVIVGGVGVNTIIYYESKLLGKWIDKGSELGTFRAEGSAFAMFSNQELALDSKIVEATAQDDKRPIEVLVGESLASVMK